LAVERNGNCSGNRRWYGTYFIATNVTPGTAQAYNIQSTFSDTTPLLYIQNNDSKANPQLLDKEMEYLASRSAADSVDP
jgi:hypothetical protein